MHLDARVRPSARLGGPRSAGPCVCVPWLQCNNAPGSRSALRARSISRSRCNATSSSQHSWRAQFAPKKFASDPEAKATNTSAKQFDEAMARLFAAGRIRVLTEGRPSHQTSRIVETAAQIIPFPSPATPPADSRPTTSQVRPTRGEGGGGRCPPITPPESAGGRPTVEAASPADGSGPSVGSLSTDSAESAATPAAKPITAGEMDELRRRGFSPEELFNMNPKRARKIIADPKRNKLTEHYGKGSDAPPRREVRPPREILRPPALFGTRADGLGRWFAPPPPPVRRRAGAKGAIKPGRPIQTIPNR